MDSSNREVRAGDKRSRGKTRANGYTSVSRDSGGTVRGADSEKEADGEMDTDGRPTRGSAPQPSLIDPSHHSSLIRPSSPSELAAATAVSVSSVLIAGAGFMCDAYDLFIMNVLLVVMGCEYGGQSGDELCKLSSADEASLASAVVVGAVSAHFITQRITAHMAGREPHTQLPFPPPHVL